VVRWDRVQPRAGERAAWSLPDRGCVRDRGPCAAYAGVREQLRAVRSQQRAGGGFEVLVVLTGLPAWAGSREPGCEPPGTPAPRAIAPAALPAYRALVASLLDLARREGVALRWWSAWNEPNLSAFLAPQRARCDVTAPTLAPARYAAVPREQRSRPSWSWKGSGGARWMSVQTRSSAWSLGTRLASSAKACSAPG